MKLKIYSIYDTKAKSFGTPFFMDNEEVAIRALADLVNDQSSTLSQHPEDYLLKTLGEFDTNTGAIEYKKTANYTKAVSLVKKETQVNKQELKDILIESQKLQYEEIKRIDTLFDETESKITDIIKLITGTKPWWRFW